MSLCYCLSLLDCLNLSFHLLLVRHWASFLLLSSSLFLLFLNLLNFLILSQVSLHVQVDLRFFLLRRLLFRLLLVFSDHLLSAVCEEISMVARRQHPWARVNARVRIRRKAEITLPVIQLKVELDSSMNVMRSFNIIAYTRFKSKFLLSPPFA